MESIGEFFKQVRETKGLTIDEVASKTRIRTDFVKALEDGNFAKLPDQVFARGFVRSYARSLGLDEEDAIHRFAQSAGAYYDKQVERERLKVRQAEEERKRQANRKAVAIAIGIAILTLIFLLSREQSSLLVRKSSTDVPPAASKRPAPATPEPQDAPPSQQAEVVPPAPPPWALSPNLASPLPRQLSRVKEILLDRRPIRHPQLRLRRIWRLRLLHRLEATGRWEGFHSKGPEQRRGNWHLILRRQS